LYTFKKIYETSTRRYKIKIGFIGLGKLGFPCAVAMEQVGGHQIKALDTNPIVRNILESKSAPYVEKGFNKYLQKTHIELVKSIDELVTWAEIIFIAVQTPHEELYEGASPVPSSKVDFDYSILESVVTDLSESLLIHSDFNPLIVVISTVLPGTMKNRVIPKLARVRNKVRFCYNPYFIAMGTTIPDFLHPEFVLVGTLQEEDGKLLEKYYKTIHKAPIMQMQIESAELTKVAYNTFIGFKIVFANTIAEITEKRGGNPDEVTNALSKATSRLMSGKYMRAGMADGGGCHPRDQIAMSWLAEDADLSVDLFGWLAKARDSQTKRQADLIEQTFHKTNLPICILGWSYKPETALIVGSPARLLGEFLRIKSLSFEIYDPYVFPEKQLANTPHIFFVATNHENFKYIDLPEGSTVIDPWGMRSDYGQNVHTILPGRPNNP
jgi:UDPglucose 6-dehydrogenase